MALQMASSPESLFNRLNPSIEPYDTGLYVQTDAKSWPKMPDGNLRRVSVNIFGKSEAAQIARPNQSQQDSLPIEGSAEPMHMQSWRATNLREAQTKFYSTKRHH